MNFLAPLLTLALLLACASLAKAELPLVQEKELSRLWLDLDGDQAADRVTIVDTGVPGAATYVLRVKLNEGGQILEAANVIPAPANEGLWSASPKYKLEKTGPGAFVLELKAGDYDAYRGFETYRYAISLKNGELVVHSFLAISDHLSVGDPNRHLNLNYRFLDGKILGKLDNWHGEIHNRQGASEPLPSRCRGPQPLSSWSTTDAPACALNAAQRLQSRLDALAEK